jgi:hypothetical protein
MDKHPIRVPAAVLRGLEAVRLTGATHMLDRPRVIQIAEMMGEDATAAWARANRGQFATYAQLHINAVILSWHLCHLLVRIHARIAEEVQPGRNITSAS